ncbi:MAG: beta-methylgalactoside transporter, partial [Deltaproteobacteria bacterium]|nr:beta-methylgalactoside transporter [Deltaproteobacteria bacterium]
MGNIFSVKRPFDVKRIREFSSKNAIFLVLLGLIAFTAIIKPSFLQIDNLLNILRISSVRAIIALGVGGILITRGTDLSAGRTVGFAACIAASLSQRPDYASKLFPDLPLMPLIVPILAALAVGLLIGIFNGTVVAFLNVPPFIATLGTMVIVYGAVSLYVDRPPRGAQPIGGLREDFTNLGTADTFGIPNLILIAVVIMLVIFVILTKTRLGKNIYAIGGNPEAAVVSGVNVKKNLIIVYIIGGLLYGLAGVLLAARTGGATNNYGMSYE